MPAKIRLGWKELSVTYNLAYYKTAIITAIRSFIVLRLVVVGHVFKVIFNYVE